ncbi:hypothetical protein E3T39_04335 [Cryobacterium suzukii]|uniref:Uncharacterized protein n=1 Tax=Cryobacterium suzukii TaxID=1259198 RepID=A0A4R9AJD3_9MICO|nr:hypothetical protein [Cryobacterium suzukii]TFD62229.1 hypothetical protein E3T39_04335 [Cryobacterium suzukii]
MTDARFDPKHDARYQRGYEPGDSADAGSSAMTELFAPTSRDQPAASVGTDRRDSVALPVFANGAPDDGDQVDQVEPLNPFIIALWVIGPALTIGGLVLQVRTILESFGNSGFTGSSSAELPIEVVMQQLVWHLAPAMITTGLATTVGLLFFQALRWRSRVPRR